MPLERNKQNLKIIFFARKKYFFASKTNFGCFFVDNSVLRRERTLKYTVFIPPVLPLESN